MSGPAWDALETAGNASCPVPDLSNQSDEANVCVMAKALIFARTGDPVYRLRVVDAIWSIVNVGVYRGRALALGRELAAYVIAADLIDLKSYFPTLDARFRQTLVVLRTTATIDGPASLVACHELRPNNWGT
jgi:hypothetical protein